MLQLHSADSLVFEGLLQFHTVAKILLVDQNWSGAEAVQAWCKASLVFEAGDQMQPLFFSAVPAFLLPT